MKGLLMRIWEFMCNAFQWYLDLPNTTEVTLTVLSIIILPIVGFSVRQIIIYRKSEKYKAKCNLKEFNHVILDLINKERVFFNEEDDKGFLFYENVPIKKLNTNEKVSLKEANRTSYLLMGEAGCGKSSVLKQDFKSKYGKFSRKIHFKTGWLFINNDLFEKEYTNIFDFSGLEKCVKETEYRNWNIYIDGVDEFSEANLASVYKLLSFLSGKIGVIKVTSRTEFAQTNIIHNNQVPACIGNISRYIVDRWDTDELLKIASLILNAVKIQGVDKQEIVAKIQEDARNWQRHVESPLLMKLYIYILLFGGVSQTIQFDNKYSFYSQFVHTLILVYMKNHYDYNINNIDEYLDEISYTVFQAFQSSSKQIQLESDNIGIVTVLKPSNSQSMIFVHETFFEYFTARYYLNQISSPHIRNADLKVFQQPYTNDFADFITAAINNKDLAFKEIIVKRFLGVYCSTFNETTYSRVLRDFNSDFIEEISLQTRRDVAGLDEQSFFTLKYEIIFRLGRIECGNEELREKIVGFLEFIYDFDDNIKHSKLRNYFIAVIKRCCAISCSFLGAERVELDYVSKMLPIRYSVKNSDYIEEYDLANRSHTLIFYGDVNNTSIFDFQDISTSLSCELAFSKRIERLEYKLVDDTSQMDGKAKRKYYFRIFDLATIFTFMYNRSRKLTERQTAIIVNTQVHFEGASKERNDLMDDMQKMILDLNERLWLI